MRKELIRQNRRVLLYLHQINGYPSVPPPLLRRTNCWQFCEDYAPQRVCKPEIVSEQHWLDGAEGERYARSTFERTKSTLSFLICRIVTCGPCSMSYSPGTAINDDNTRRALSEGALEFPSAHILAGILIGCQLSRALNFLGLF